MAGTSRSIVSVVFTGLRVATQSIYVPAHSKNGQNISQRCVVTAGANTNRGGKEERNYYKLTFWGKAADVAAKSLPIGKEFNARAIMNTYQGKVYHRAGEGQTAQAVVMSDGTPLMTTRIGFTVREFTLGAESEKHIATQIQEGKRPANWNVPGHPDSEAWKAALKQWQAQQFSGGSSFGYARVEQPQGPGIGAYTPQASTPAASAPSAAPMTPQVAQAVAPQGGFTPAQPAAPAAPAPAVASAPTGV